MLPSSWLAAGALGGMVIAGTVGYLHGVNVAEMRCQAKISEINDAMEKAKAEYLAAQQAKAAELEQALADNEASRKEIARETQKIIVRPVYRNVCLDPDGLRQLERARLGGKGAASQPAAKVPGTSQ